MLFHSSTGKGRDIDCREELLWIASPQSKLCRPGVTGMWMNGGRPLVQTDGHKIEKVTRGAAWNWTRIGVVWD